MSQCARCLLIKGYGDQDAISHLTELISCVADNSIKLDFNFNLFVYQASVSLTNTAWPSNVALSAYSVLGTIMQVRRRKH